LKDVVEAEAECKKIEELIGKLDEGIDQVKGFYQPDAADRVESENEHELGSTEDEELDNRTQKKVIVEEVGRTEVKVNVDSSPVEEER
jgi:hypothetical protein